MLLGCLLLLAAACVLRILIDRGEGGGVSLRWPDAAWASFRIVPMVAAVIIGAGLGASGLSLQVLLRNPLVSPWILGLSSGAGLGMMATLYVQYVTGEHAWWGEVGGAVLGSAGALSVVYLLSRRRGGIDPISMVLVGVVISVMCGAGIMVFQHLVPMGLRGQFTTWLMGRIPEVASAPVLVGSGVIVLGGVALLTNWGPTLDAACLSDDEAASVGVDLPSLRRRLFVLSSLLAAVAVMLAGPIAFVGLIAPHAGRLLVSSRHRQLVLVSATLGALLLVGAEDARQLIDLGTGRMPVGILTSLLGGLVFLVLLLRGRVVR